MRFGIQILVIVLFVSPFVKAQESCSDKLLRAENLYEQGLFTEAVDLARSCTNSNDPADMWKAYRMLAMSYLANNQNTEAREAAEQMLVLNPTYKADVLNDPKDLRALLEKIDIIPKLSMGLSFMYGGNITIPRATARYNVTSVDKNYSGRPGYQLGLVTGYNLNDRHGIEAHLLAKSLRYQMQYTSYGNDFTIDETLNSFDLPFYYRYTLFPGKRFRVLLKGGVYGSVLVNSFNDLARSNAEAESVVKHYYSLGRRNRLNGGVNGGLGCMYKWQKGHLSLDMLYIHGLTNISNPDVRYENETLIFDYHYLDDDIQLSDFSISIGYHMYINYKLNK